MQSRLQAKSVKWLKAWSCNVSFSLFRTLVLFRVDLYMCIYISPVAISPCVSALCSSIYNSIWFTRVASANIQKLSIRQEGWQPNWLDELMSAGKFRWANICPSGSIINCDHCGNKCLTRKTVTVTVCTANTTPTKS